VSARDNATLRSLAERLRRLEERLPQMQMHDAWREHCQMMLRWTIEDLEGLVPRPRPPLDVDGSEDLAGMAARERDYDREQARWER